MSNNSKLYSIYEAPKARRYRASLQKRDTNVFEVFQHSKCHNYWTSKDISVFFLFKWSCKHLLSCCLTAMDKIDGSLEKVHHKRNTRWTVPSGFKLPIC